MTPEILLTTRVPPGYHPGATLVVDIIFDWYMKYPGHVKNKFIVTIRHQNFALIAFIKSMKHNRM